MNTWSPNRVWCNKGSNKRVFDWFAQRLGHLKCSAMNSHVMLLCAIINNISCCIKLYIMFQFLFTTLSDFANKVICNWDRATVQMMFESVPVKMWRKPEQPNASLSQRLRSLGLLQNTSISPTCLKNHCVDPEMEPRYPHSLGISPQQTCLLSIFTQ